MAGDERVRRCGRCSLRVYNLAALSEAEGQRLIAEMEGRVWARLYRRADGTVLTRDCPGAPASTGRRIAMAAALASVFVASEAAVDRVSAFVAGSPEAVEAVVPVDDGEWIVGDVAVPEEWAVSPSRPR